MTLMHGAPAKKNMFVCIVNSTLYESLLVIFYIFLKSLISLVCQVDIFTINSR